MSNVCEATVNSFKEAVCNLNKAIALCKAEDPKCFAYFDGGMIQLVDSQVKPTGDDKDKVLAEMQLNAVSGDW